MFVATGCGYAGSSPGKELDEARQMITTQPQGALELLNACDVAAMEDSADIARWALLYCEALAANGLKAPTDTIPAFAVEYYGSRQNDCADDYRKACKLREMIAAGKDDALSTARYLQKEREFYLYRERVRRERITATAGALLLVALALIIWQRQRIRLQRARNDALIAETSSLSEGLRLRQEEKSGMERKLALMLRERFSDIDGLCETYFESQGTKAERNAIVQQVKTRIEALKSDGEMLGRMERCVNECSGGVLDSLRCAWPDIKECDYRLYLYLACGMSNRSIALLLGESMEVVYKRKSRLKARIKALETEESGRLLEVF